MRLALIAAALAVPAVATAQTTVYSNDFESGVLGAEWSGAGAIETTGGLSAFGFGLSHLRNGTTAASVLTLGGLAPHTSMTLLFDLAMWDSIDLGSDIFRLFVDGAALYDGTFGNYFPTSGVCEGPGTLLTEPFPVGTFAVPDYGVNSGFRDCGRAVAFTFAHSAASAVISFVYPNSQGSTDESFGVDNVLVRTNAQRAVTAVPEPGTWTLLGAGLLALGGVARRRQAGSTANSRSASRS